MKISYWPESTALNSAAPYTAAVESLAQLGHTLVKNSYDADVALIWSVLWHGRMTANKSVWNHYRNQNKPVIVIEVGSIKRGTTWKVGLNGINRDAYFGPSGMDDLRSRKLGLQLKPWQQNGEYILICGQHDKSLQWQGMPSMSNWFLQTYDEIRKYTDRPIVFRPHPRCRLPAIEQGLRYVYRQDPLQINETYDDYNLDFDNTWATINYSSNPGIQSVIAGIPAFVGTGSLAYDVANDINLLCNIQNPLTPDRQQWLNNYAWTEYTVEEIAQGLPWQRLRNALNC